MTHAMQIVGNLMMRTTPRTTPSEIWIYIYSGILWLTRCIQCIQLCARDCRSRCRRNLLYHQLPSYRSWRAPLWWKRTIVRLQTGLEEYRLPIYLHHWFDLSATLFAKNLPFSTLLLCCNHLSAILNSKKFKSLGYLVINSCILCIP